LSSKRHIDLKEYNGLSDDADYLTLTAVSKQNFENLISSIKSILHNSKVRSKRTSVGIILVKLRMGLLNKLQSALIGIQQRNNI